MIEVIIVLILSLVAIMLSSSKVVDYISKIANMLGISGLSAGLVILSISTSLPELMVSIYSSVTGSGGIGIGNVLGANIADVTLVLGMSILISRRKFISFKKSSFENLIRFLFVSSVIPLFILQTGRVSIMLGIILLILFILFNAKVPKKVEGSQKVISFKEKGKFFLVFKFLIAMTIMLVASRLVVDNSVIIAESLGIPLSVIGATIVSIGTTLPELTTTIQAFRKKLYDIGLGNAIGSCITNLTLVLGMSSLLNPSEVNIVSTTTLIIFAIISTILTWYFVSTEKRLSRKEAVLLIIFYLIFIAQELGFSIFNFF
jgi:cation:H+ antiporter